uniref:BCL2 apoptosis regulator n=1 Tax=Cyprinus carpio carpio TaxID=630221 RepID=A0A9J8BR82_CYPCA
MERLRRADATKHSTHTHTHTHTTVQLVKYIHHKLWKKGYVWERQEDRGGTRHDPCSALHTVLREAGDELERLYQSDFAEMSKQLHITSITAQQRFTAVIDELFRDGVNWGRIIAFFEFGGTVCVECVNKEMTAHVDNICILLKCARNFFMHICRIYTHVGLSIQRFLMRFQDAHKNRWMTAAVCSRAEGVALLCTTFRNCC